MKCACPWCFDEAEPGSESLMGQLTCKRHSFEGLLESIDPDVDRVTRRLEEMRAFAHALKVHIDGCEACSGPDDGCEIVKTMESLCIHDLRFDPYPLIADMRSENVPRG